MNENESVNIDELSHRYNSIQEEIRTLQLEGNEIVSQIQEVVSGYQINLTPDIVKEEAKFVDYKECEIETSSILSWAECPGIDQYYERGDFLFHTRNDDHAWWRMDMLKPFNVKRITIVNRKDCCRERLNPAIVEVLDREKKIVWEGKIETTESSYTWDNVNAEGRFIRVELLRSEYLHFASITVEI